MPCSDSSSSIAFRIDHEERLISFDYAKITCGREIQGGSGLKEYYRGKDLNTILQIPFAILHDVLCPKDEETQFILYLEWDALRSAIAQYLGIEDESIDKDRCRITSVDYTHEGIEVSEVILPPKEMPKILPCSLGDKKDS
ncbi:MAG: hypothetical protein KC733_02845 [Candidatus Omnitrophica bacterium]|nr:hypothetical protein [Candidatus Omnitrophota bacterium]